MQVKQFTSFSVLYAFVCSTVIAANTAGYHSAEYVLKPLMMPILALWYGLNTPKPYSTVNLLMLGALFFSCCGDIFLMILPGTDGLFIAGLVSFLLAHLFYISAYKLQAPRFSAGVIAQNKFLLLPFAAYGLLLVYFLLPGLGGLAAPVAVYAAIIIAMALFALNRWGWVNRRSFTAVFVGALIFIASDSMIALNKFYQPIYLARVWILSTYCLAQWLIVWGMLLHQNNNATANGG